MIRDVQKANGILGLISFGQIMLSRQHPALRPQLFKHEI